MYFLGFAEKTSFVAINRPMETAPVRSPGKIGLDGRRPSEPDFGTGQDFTWVPYQTWQFLASSSQPEMPRNFDTTPSAYVLLLHSHDP